MTDLFIKTVEVDTTTLASTTALAVDDSLKDFKEALLLTKCKTEVNGDWPNIATDKLLLVLAYGDATVTQVKAAFEDQTANPEDGTTWRIDQAKARVIIDFVALKPPQTAGDTQAQSIMWDIPRKGLPSAKGNGFRLLVFNVGAAALTNGPTLANTTKWYLQRLNS